MPLVPKNVDMYDFPLNLSNETMMYLEWGGIVRIYSSEGKQRKKYENDPMETTFTKITRCFTNISTGCQNIYE